MDGKKASYLFVGVCILLAILLIAGVISPLTSGLLFAVALVALGGVSGGFRKQPPKQSA
ncbi:MAG TPA: hypothetical protein VMH23_06365 [Bacteroidota bacterium]|nr:hypothetical protein [Bacteroidota bacterium]